MTFFGVDRPSGLWEQVTGEVVETGTGEQLPLAATKDRLLSRAPPPPPGTPAATGEGEEAVLAELREYLSGELGAHRGAGLEDLPKGERAVPPQRGLTDQL